MYMFMLFQTNKFPFIVQKLDQQWEPQSVVFWTSLEDKHMNLASQSSLTDDELEFIFLCLSKETSQQLATPLCI